MSNKQRHLMAACAHGASYAACPPLKVAREFNRADQRAGTLSRAAGGSTPLEGALNATLNFGQGPGQNFFSTTPLMGHALSGSLAKPKRAQRRFADGGEVKKPAGPSAKERQQIRDMIERGKTDAIAALRDMRSELLSTVPAAPSDISASLAKLQGRLAMKRGGRVDAADVPDDPDIMYAQYRQLLQHLEDPQLDERAQMQIVDRLTQLESDLGALGIDVAEGAPA